MKCPNCHLEMDIALATVGVNRAVIVDPTIKMTKKNRVNGTLLKYWRWVAEGKPKYETEQWYYDDYHDAIEYLGDNLYRYRIQTFDSPEGDVWIEGTFRVTSTGIEIVEGRDD